VLKVGIHVPGTDADDQPAAQLVLDKGGVLGQADRVVEG